MPSNKFLNQKEVLEGNDALGYIDYGVLSEENKEFLLTNGWDFEFIIPPSAVYFPGNNLIKARLTGVDMAVPSGLTEVSAVYRGFTIRQSVISGTTAGTITLNFTDREDQAISAFIDDWRDKMGTRENRFAFRKEDTIAEGKLTMYNTSRKPIRVYTFKALQINEGSGTLNVAFNSDDPQQAGMCSLPLSFEHFTYEMLNTN
jgi:hypothetical protein